MLDDPARAPQVVDREAGWPHDVAVDVAGLVRGMVVPRVRANRFPLEQALERLVGLADAAELPPGVSAAPQLRECVCCMVEPRAARFRCGHCMCCESCADALQQRGDGCPVCRVPIVIAGRGVHLAGEKTFVRPA